MYHGYDMGRIIADLKAPTKKNFILDTDAFNEIDDQYAITYAMLSERVNLLALTAAPFYNTRSTSPKEGMEMSYDEMVKVRDMVDPEGKMNIPCYRGSEDYMTNTETPVYSEAAENIVRIVKETDGIVYVAVIGCFTNVASALLIDPSIKDKVVVLMVGSNCFDYHTCRECNLEQNPSAARVIFECGVPVVVLPAMGNGGTGRILTTTAEVFYYLEGKAGKIGDYLCKLYSDEEGTPDVKDGKCHTMHRAMWDLAAVALLDMPDSIGEINIVPAHTITPDGEKWVNLENGKNMIYVDQFRRSAIMSRFFSIMRSSNLK